MLLALCYPPLHPLVLPFAALVPLAVWVAALPDGPAGRASARRGVGLFAVVHFGLLFHWLLPALSALTPVGPALFVLGLLLLGSLTVLWGVALHSAVVGLRAPIWLALPVSWTGLEWTMAHLPGPLAMPWLGLGTTLTAVPEAVGIAELVGARGVTFWIAAVNGLAASALLRGRDASGSRGALGRAAAWLAILLLVAAPVGWGFWRASTLEIRSVGRVALVQPAVPQRVRLDADAVRRGTFALLDELVPSIPRGSVRVAVLPEMVLPIEPGAPGDSVELRRLREYADEVGAPILFGARGRAATGDPSPRNSAFLMEPGGLADFRYDKRRLVPVVERSLMLPLGVPARYRPVGDFAAGTGWSLADVEGVAFGATICFESAFADIGRGLRAAGADVLVNLTNDAWFGTGPSEARGAALWQHPAHLVMRAIETRAGVVRVANVGFSFAVDPVGRLTDVTDPFDPSIAFVDVRTSDVQTLWVRVGDVTGRASAAGLGLLLLTAWLRRRRPSGDG